MTTKNEILTILEKNKGQYISGAQIAEQIHITRSAVWKGIKALKEDGYAIAAGTHRGYMLSPTNDIFSSASVKALLAPACRNLQIEVQTEVTSTNTLLKEAAKNGAPEGQVLIARHQTAGKGRMGRSFYSPMDSGLYLSILLRPSMTLEHSTLLTTVAAVAVAKAMEDVTGEPVDIKWVNDVYRHGKKLCGILTEASVNFESGTLEYAIVGIGINLTDPEGGFPEEIRDIAGSLYGASSDNVCPAGTRTRLAAGILNYFMSYYQTLPAISFLDEYRKRSCLVGKDILVYSAMSPSGGHMGIPKEAHAEYVDDNLRLVVTYPDGSTEALSSGEVSTRLIPHSSISF